MYSSGVMVRIPRITVAPLFGDNAEDQAATDAALIDAARTIGFVTLQGIPRRAILDDHGIRALTAVFALDDGRKRALHRHAFAPANHNLYRGFLPAQFGAISYKEQMDIGPDAVDPARLPADDDPLHEPTPWPDEALLPAWRSAVAQTYAEREALGLALLRSLARGFGKPEDALARHFQRGISTLRLIRYVRPTPEQRAAAPPERMTLHKGQEHYLVVEPHCDSGFVTILSQDEVGGLQVNAAGTWLDIPPERCTLIVNFGKLLERWTAGAVKATEHRVIDCDGAHTERIAIPFFLEPEADTLIEPFDPDAREPITGASFRYGNYLWEHMQSFPEFRGLGADRFSAARAIGQ